MCDFTYTHVQFNELFVCFAQICLLDDDQCVFLYIFCPVAWLRGDVP